jgi:hypothetical protein
MLDDGCRDYGCGDGGGGGTPTTPSTGSDPEDEISDEANLPLSPSVYGPPDPTIDQLELGLPRTKILHPLNGNTVSQIPLYDYSYDPPRVIGYRITSYAYDEAHFSLLNFVVPSDPITWGSITWDVAKQALKPIAEQAASVGIDISIPVVGEVLATISALDSLNSAITFDTHIRTHDVYFTSPTFLLAPYVEIPLP